MNLLTLDEKLFLEINGFVGRIPILDQTVELIVNEYFVPVSLTLILFYLWLHPDKKRELHRKALSIAILSIGLINLIIVMSNQFIVRPRPFDQIPANLLFYRPTDPSFPSNAAAVGFALAVSIFLVNRKWGVLAIILALFFSLSRVYAGVHFPFDVVAGAVLGVSAVFLINKFHSPVKKITSMLERIQTWLKLDLDY
jgi:undecaprenyl-diphosphatase